MAIGKVPSKLPKPCIDLNYLSIRLNFNDYEENSAALCLLRSCPNLQEIEILVNDLRYAYVKFYIDCIPIFFLKTKKKKEIKKERKERKGRKKNCLINLYLIPLHGDIIGFLYPGFHVGSPRGTSCCGTSN